MGGLYDAAELKANMEGNTIVQTKDEYFENAIGTRNDWVKKQIDSGRTAEKVAGDFFLNFVPIYGTYKTWKDTGSFALTGLSVAGDLLFFIPVISATAAGVRAGGGVLKSGAKAVGREALGTVAAPYYMHRSDS